MTATACQAHQDRIDAIDKLIDANRRAMFGRLHFAPCLSATEWQTAWDRCPDLRAHDSSLFRERGIAQDARDKAINAEWQNQQRCERAARRKAA